MPASPAHPSGHRQSVRPRLPAGSITEDFLSKTTLLVCVSLFVVGVVFGTVSYMQRSPVVDKQVAGTNAVPTHVVLALVAVGLLLASLELKYMIGATRWSPWISHLIGGNRDD
jgi:hypothetical protein